jgi:hypothetical protein
MSTSYPVYEGHAPVSRRPDGLVLVVLYHALSGLISLLGMCAAFSLPLVVGLAAADSRQGVSPVLVVGLVTIFIAGLLLVIAAANLVVGWGLWQRREWARLAALGLAIIRLLNLPFGTVAGGLIIWYLLQDHVKAGFRS